MLVVFGVSGAGKSTVGRLLADRLGYSFAEGDEFHPPANVARMSAGEPLTDAHRKPWLESLAAAIRAWIASGENVVLACSALKRGYRHTLAGGSSSVRFLYLAADPETIRARLAMRTGHFMPPALLDSQFEALEAPGPEESVLEVRAEGTPEETVDRILAALPANGSGDPL